MIFPYHGTAIVFSTALAVLAIGDVAQMNSGVTICVVFGGNQPHCLGDPLPAILDDARPQNRPREFDYRGDGPVVPYRAR